MSSWRVQDHFVSFQEHASDPETFLTENVNVKISLSSSYTAIGSLNNKLLYPSLHRTKLAVGGRWRKNLINNKPLNRNILLLQGGAQPRRLTNRHYLTKINRVIRELVTEYWNFGHSKVDIAVLKVHLDWISFPVRKQSSLHEYFH